MKPMAPWCLLLGSWTGGHSGWTTVGNSQLRLTNRALTWNEAQAECQRLGGTLFDPGQSNQLLFQAADRLFGNGDQYWLNMQYVENSQVNNGMQGPGWYWLNSSKSSNVKVSLVHILLRV